MRRGDRGVRRALLHLRPRRSPWAVLCGGHGVGRLPRGVAAEAVRLLRGGARPTGDDRIHRVGHAIVWRPRHLREQRQQHTPRRYALRLACGGGGRGRGDGGCARRRLVLGVRVPDRRDGGAAPVQLLCGGGDARRRGGVGGRRAAPPVGRRGRGALLPRLHPHGRQDGRACCSDAAEWRARPVRLDDGPPAERDRGLLLVQCNLSGERRDCYRPQ
mmetsp:Transcript_60429/g.179607  ORF Transcript_60429/g.179607 Transcript_60429/m.179607 type:complete len:216 (+) Transcript_60429:2122-2769(+)